MREPSGSAGEPAANEEQAIRDQVRAWGEPDMERRACGRTPLAKCSGRKGGKTRDAGRSERTLGQPSCEAIKVEGRGGRHVLQACLGQPTVARLAQGERAHALRERTLAPLTLGIKLTAGFTLQAGPSGRERLVFGARA